MLNPTPLSDPCRHLSCFFFFFFGGGEGGWIAGYFLSALIPTREEPKSGRPAALVLVDFYTCKAVSNSSPDNSGSQLRAI